jgi:Fe-S cluster assembly protein SufD
MSAVLDFPLSSAAKPEVRPYLDAFRDSAGEPQWLRQARRHGMTRFAELGFPTRRSESWRYLDLQLLQQKPLLPVEPGKPASVSTELELDSAWARAILIDGHCKDVAARPLPDGVWLGSMRRAIDERPDLVRAITTEDSGADHPFVALNTAFFSDGFVLDLAPGTALDRPIQIIHFASASGSLHTRSLINVGEGARATILETYAGEGRYWRNDIVTVYLAAGAELNRAMLVEEAKEAVHLAEVGATLNADARFSGFALLLGGGTVRHEVSVRFAGEGAQCRLDGAFVVSGREEANIVTNVDHQVPHGETRELIKGVASGRAHGAFQGKITVREHALKVDAHQLSRNLILGRRAVIDTKPELEIYADDVKCSHGASVGELDETALFYLRSRGIPDAEARHMLIEGFLREPVEEIADPALREHLLRRLARRLEKLEG